MGLDAGALTLYGQKKPTTAIQPPLVPPLGTPTPLKPRTAGVPGIGEVATEGPGMMGLFGPQVAHEGPGMTGGGVTAVPLPPMHASPFPPTPTSGGGANLAPPAPPSVPGGAQYQPFTDTRSSIVTAPTTPLQTQATGQLSSALKQAQTSANAVPGYTPTPGPNFGAAQGALGQASTAIGGANASSPEAQQLRQMGMSGLQGLQGPDRAGLAAQSLALQRQLTQPQWEQDLRKVGQSASALGRLGSGMTTSELGDVTLQREKALGLYGQQAALDAAGQSLNDKLGVFNATSGYGNQIAGQDLAQGNFGLQKAGAYAGLGGQQAGLASASANFGADQNAQAQQAAMQKAALQQSLVGTLGGVQGQQFNQGLQTAGLATQQQGFQNTLQQQAEQARVQQQMLQEQLLNGQFNRQLSGAQALGGFGYTNDPYGLQLAGSNATQNQATDQSSALQQFLQQQALQRALATYGGG